MYWGFWFIVGFKMIYNDLLLGIFRLVDWKGVWIFMFKDVFY